MNFEDSIKGYKVSIGDCAMTCNMCACIILQIHYNNEYNIYEYSVYNVSRQQYEKYNEEDIVNISKEVFDYLLTLSNNMRNMITKLKYPLDDNDYSKYGKFINRLKLLTSLSLNNLQDIETQRVLFSNGIKRIIKHEKGKGTRIIEFNNGEIWRCKRIKIKKSPLIHKIIKNIEKQKKIYGNNPYGLPRIATTHYELIERI